MGPTTGWLFTPVPLARVALLRRAIYAFVIVDVLYMHSVGYYHGWVAADWYEPLVIGRMLHLPAATVLLVEVLRWGTVAAAVLGLVNRFPRLAGWATAVGWIWFQYVAFAYGKVDHDRGDFVIALLVLPLVGVATVSDRRLSEAAGFAFRAIQLTAIATYFLSACAKLRFGGPEWVNSATLVRAVVRRGTWFGDQLLQVPWTLHTTQWLLISLELLSPVIFFVTERWRRRMVGGWYVFHAMTWAAITIAFWPHLIMLLAFLPLEQYRDRLAAWWRRRRERSDPGRDGAGGRASGQPTAVAGHPAIDDAGQAAHPR